MQNRDDASEPEAIDRMDTDHFHIPIDKMDLRLITKENGKIVIFAVERQNRIKRSF